jgi:DNA-binding MarR family transcriptional regulator
MSSSARDQLIQALMTEYRYVSANSVMFSQALADRAGIPSTDNECLDFLMLKGPATAGQLAQLTGLTTGAITAVIDRLEKAGFVQREQDKKDRRRVIVVPNEAKILAEIVPYAMPMGEAMAAICADFTDDELDAILRFAKAANSKAVTIIAQTRAAK